ncbi:hypothetical protein [Asticcacaulis sp.]|uniref:hypothetical protein n=1 Tax=Asticcacaulis sp. TaxID=1872648 RepID=UPI003F7C9FC4
MPLSAISFFCEDVRKEFNGGETIVGLMSDNLTVEVPSVAPPTGHQPALPKICVYTRINFDMNSVPDRLAIVILLPDGKELGRNVIAKSVIDQAASEMGSNGLVGIKAELTIGNFVLIPGLFKVIVETSFGDYVSGILNVHT